MMGIEIVPSVFADYIEQPRWIDWKYELKNGKQNKSPIDPHNGRYASSTNPQTWASFDLAMKAQQQYRCTGIGIILGRGLGGVDLDGCRNPETGAITPWAQEIIRDFKSYTEVSPSKTGVKIWATGAPRELPANTISMNTPPIQGKVAKVEVFTHSRYFAVTGEVLENVPDEIAECTEAWERLITRLSIGAKTQTHTGEAVAMSERLVCDIQQRESLNKLWHQGKDGGKDRSRNDSSLAATLGALGYDDADIEAALRTYPLGQIGQGFLTGTTASRQIVRLLGIAADCRPRQAKQSSKIEAQESDLKRVSDLLPAVQELYRTGLQPGESPGWISLQQYWTLRPGEWTLVTGVPSHGKSGFVDAVMMNLAKSADWKWAVWSGENLPQQTHVANLLEQYTNKPFNEGYRPRMTASELETAMQFLDEHFIFLSPPEDEETPGRMVAAVEKAIEARRINGIVLDPWNELTHTYIENKQSETEYISGELKRIRRFAAKHQIHVIIVAHPKKLQKDGNGRYPVPTPYDVSSSAHWRNKADCALCIWRDEERPGETVVFIQKVRRRFVGKIGKVELLYDIATGKYSEPNQANYRREPGEEG